MVAAIGTEESVEIRRALENGVNPSLVFQEATYLVRGLAYVGNGDGNRG